VSFLHFLPSFLHISPPSHTVRHKVLLLCSLSLMQFFLPAVFPSCEHGMISSLFVRACGGGGGGTTYVRV
jgi:hypothetical protein